MRRWLIAVLILSLLTAVFFLDLLIEPSGILYSNTSDFIALHIPARQFLVRSFQETSELPLWDPLTYAGSPFVHDLQVSMFYPPHLALCLVPEEHVGPVLSWLVVLHVWLAGLFMFAYARQQNLNPLPALVAAFGWMFAGRWMLHLLAGGHYLLVGLAWLPLALLLLERAIDRRSWSQATLGGVCLGLMTLGTQPQWTFYAGLLIAAWTLGAALQSAGAWQDPRPRIRWMSVLVPWMSFGLWTALVALGLAAIQLLPAWEAAQHSLRARGLDPGHLEVNPLQPLVLAIGPALSARPTTLAWEDRGGLTLVWLVTACLAPLVTRGLWRFRAWVALGLAVFACGGFVLLQGLPGFNLFRQHGRMLIIVAFPLSLLAAATVQYLFVALTLEVGLLQRCRKVARLLVLGASVLVVGVAFRVFNDPAGEPVFHIYWLTLLATIPLAFWLLMPGCPLRPGQRQALWCLLLAVDLWALTRPLVEVRDPAEVYAGGLAVQYMIDNNPQGQRVLDRDDPLSQLSSPLGTGAPMARTFGIPSVKGFNPVDVLRFKEYLQFISGADRELKAFDDSGFTFPVIRDFPVKNRELLNLLGVRYLLQPTGLPSIFADDDQTPSRQQDGWKVVCIDPLPRTYDLDEGSAELPAYAVYENTQVYPRAFVVPTARPLPARAEVLSALAKADFRQTVFLEDLDTGASVPSGKCLNDEQQLVMNRSVKLLRDEPNEVVVAVGDGPPGFLVLTDIYYPGWTCAVGAPQRLFRANYLFRAVEVGSGRQVVTFSFLPESFVRGRQVTLATVALCLLLLLLTAGRAMLSRSRRVRNR